MNGWLSRGKWLLVLVVPLLWLVFEAWGQSADQAGSSGALEERRLLYALQQERSRLEAEFRQKEEKLLLKEIELKSVAAEVDKKLEELKGVRQELSQELARKSESEAQRVRELSRIYEKMDPAQAASRLGNLEEDLAVRILAGMKPKAAGRLLDALEPAKAASLSAAYASLPKEPKETSGDK